MEVLVMRLVKLLGFSIKNWKVFKIKNKKNNDTIRAKNTDLKKAEEAKKMLDHNLADSTKLMEAYLVRRADLIKV
jgi:hypothetical protein